MWRAGEGSNMIVEELYDALIEAGASEQKARAASRAIVDMDGHFTDIQTDISRLDQKVERDISRLYQKVEHGISHLDQKLERDISRLDQKLDQKISELRSYVDQRFTQVDGTLRLHNWMLGTILAFLVAVFFKVFSH
jgi:predicted  nucleic acid-binding Zn-ribbon protein